MNNMNSSTGCRMPQRKQIQTNADAIANPNALTANEDSEAEGPLDRGQRMF